MNNEKCRRIACHETTSAYHGVLVFIHFREMPMSGDRLLFCSAKCAKIWIGANL